MPDNEKKIFPEGGWKSIRFISAAVFITPLIYYFISTLINLPEKNPCIRSGALKYLFPGLSVTALFTAYYMRKYLMDIRSKKIFNKINFDISDEGTNQAAAKYTAAVIISLAISETIAIFGLIALIIYNDRFGFYQMLVISAIAMFCFRPRKDELFKLAAKMKQHDNHQILTIQKLIIK